MERRGKDRLTLFVAKKKKDGLTLLWQEIRSTSYLQKSSCSAAEAKFC